MKTEKIIGLTEYRQLLKTLPRPTNEQIEAFIKHVVHQHQWYSMIPITPPGIPFYFYLNNGAGINEIKDGTEQFRYGIHTLSTRREPWISLVEYRMNFGWLRFHHNLDKPKSINTWILDNRHQRVLLDESMLNLCRVELTGAIHYRCIDPYFWVQWHILSPKPLNVNNWPEESGGPDQLKEILRVSD